MADQFSNFMIALKRIKFLSSCHFVTRCDKNSVPVASSLSDVSDYAYLTILSIIAQVSHTAAVAAKVKRFLEPRRFLSENSAYREYQH